ncbi:RCC1 domain-containing protein [Candidatus Hepatoplasma crinochetorum]|uniref:RCC1 domain-containing protein n=1 Tax=Candidatus Hepatoplasma crinochetorum TaxID=295596 RepID=UPI0030887BDF|nr:MAG: hypothetical protein HCTKY_0090 [Candidatus Hepatoplasma crinochetorum]
MKKIISAIAIIPIVFAFGYNNSNYKKLNKNKEIEEKIVLKDFEVGDYHSGITIDTNFDGYADTLYMWGYNNQGQIGDGTTINKYYPIKITPKGQDNWNGNIIDISLNGDHSGITVDTNYDGYADTLYMWGRNSNGEIGDGTTKDTYIPKKITPNNQNNWNGNIIDLDAGNNYSGVSIDTNYDGYADTLYMWGYNNSGQIGNGSSGSNILNPTIITPENGNWNGAIYDISFGIYHSGATIDSNYDGYADTLYMWGDNQYGQLGDGTSNDKYYPTIIRQQNQDDWDGNIIDLSLGRNHTGIVVDNNSGENYNTLYMWGANGNGQIGNGTIGPNVWYPTTITPQNQENWNGNIVDLSLGHYNSSVIIDNNKDNFADTLYMWGGNNNGQLGDGTQNNILNPKIITPENESDWNGNIIDVSSGQNFTGVLIDNNKDNFADTLYMCGSDNYGQLGNGGNSKDSKKIYFIPIASTIPNLLNTFQFYSINGKIFIELKFNDVLETIDETIEVKIIDSDGNIYNTTFIDGRSNIEEDSYYYRIDYDFDRGQTYIFDTLIINGNQFNINNYQFTTDYLISDFKITNVNSSEATVSLNLNNNGENFSLDKYTEDQRQIKINYTNLDLNTTYHKKVTLDDSYKIKLNNLNIDTNYQITSIQYFYENGSYKYKVEQDSLNFKTNEAIPKVISNSFTVIDYSINDNSFNYTVEIDNLKPNADKTGFENYDVNNGIWLIDNDDNIYNSTYLDYQQIGYSEYQGYYNYQFVFNQSGLNSNTTYLFTGITLDNLEQTLNPTIYNFNSLISVTTTGVGEQEPLIIANSISVIENSITSNSFNYVIQIDNLKLENGSNLNDPIFSNFNPKNGLYLKNNLGQIFRSDYILESEIYLGNGTTTGTSKYQFTFQINGLNSNTTYTFTEAKIVTNNNYTNIDDVIVKTLM